MTKPMRGCVAATVAVAVLAGPFQALGQEAPAVPADKPLGGGPFKAIMISDSRLATHTIYQPADLAALGAAKLPIVVWGNGACMNVGNRFRWFLSEVASYGYLAIAIGPVGPPSMEAAPQPAAPLPPNTPPPPPPSTPPASHSSQLIDAIDWAQAENERQGSRYFHRLDVKKIAVMGQSCGGVQAIEASADPRVSTTVVWNSGLFPTPQTMGGGKAMTKADLKLLHAPVAYISGDPQDIAHANANDDFAQLKGLPAFRGWERGVGHNGTYRDADGGEFGGVAVAWLNWRLKGDAQAAKMFTGKDCGLCVNPRWVVKRKAMN